MSMIFNSLTKLTVNTVLKQLIAYGIILGLVWQIISYVTSTLMADKRVSYDSLTCGLGVAIGCSLTLLLGEKLSDNIRIRIAIALSCGAMITLTYCVKLFFHPA